MLGPAPIPRLALSLDAPGLEPLEPLLDELEDLPVVAAIGAPLIASVGPSLVPALRHAGLDAVFDLRLHDTPHRAALVTTVAVRARVGGLSVRLSAGEAMVRAVIAASRGRVPIVGVLHDGWLPYDPAQVARAAALARELRLQGVMGAPRALAAVDGFDLRWATHVREIGEDVDEWTETGTLHDAIVAGATTVFVGRPVLRASDPRRRAQQLLEQLGHEGYA